MKNKNLLEDITSLKTSLEAANQERDKLVSQVNSSDEAKAQLATSLTEVVYLISVSVVWKAHSLFNNLLVMSTVPVPKAY